MSPVTSSLTYFLAGTIGLLVPVLGSQNTVGFLQNVLFADYNPAIRPRRDFNRPVELNMTLYVEHIEYLDEKEQLFVSSGSMTTIWYDDFLVWNPSDYEGIHYIYVPQQKIWIPDIYHLQGLLSYLTANPGRHNLVVVMHDGLIKKYDVGFLNTKCLIDISYFPFDEQECSIDVSMLASVVDDVIMRRMDVITEDAGDGFWKILNAHTGVYNYTDVDGTYSWASVTLKMSRSPTVFVYFLVVPILLLSGLSVLVFWLPVEAGEKVGLSISVLLSFTVFQAMLAEFMPQGSTVMPYIGQHNTAAFFVACLCLVATVVVVHVHHKTTDVPPFWKRLVLRLGNRWLVQATREAASIGFPNQEEIAFPNDDPNNEHHPAVKTVDWPTVARLLDSIFFVIFTIISVAIIIWTRVVFLLHAYG